MFSVHTTPEKFEKKNVTVTGHFAFAFEKISGREITRGCDVVVFEKLRFQKVLRPH